jgi:hypothetical protein
MTEKVAWKKQKHSVIKIRNDKNLTLYLKIIPYKEQRNVSQGYSNYNCKIERMYKFRKIRKKEYNIERLSQEKIYVQEENEEKKIIQFSTWLYFTILFH